MSKIKTNKRIIGFGILLLKPFIVPIIIISILITLASSITDMLYIAFNSEERANIEKELKYYDENIKYEENILKEFFTSVWNFVSGIFGAIFAEDTDWPVERTLYNYKLLWKT